MEKIASRRSIYRANKKGVRKERPVHDDAAGVQQADGPCQTDVAAGTKR